MWQRTLIHDRYPEARALSAFTRVFDALWRPSKGGGPGCGRASGPHPPIPGLPGIGSKMRKSAAADLQWASLRSAAFRMTGETMQRGKGRLFASHGCPARRAIAVAAPDGASV